MYRFNYLMESKHHFEVTSEGGAPRRGNIGNMGVKFPRSCHWEELASISDLAPKARKTCEMLILMDRAQKFYILKFRVIFHETMKNH